MEVDNCIERKVGRSGYTSGCRIGRKVENWKSGEVGRVERDGQK